MSALLKIEDLQIEGRDPNGDWFPIVRGVSLDVSPGEVVALIGESGAGKSSVALAAMGYAKPGCRINGGRVLFGGRDLVKLPQEELRRLRGRDIAYIPQSPAASFNSALQIGPQITEVPVVHNVSKKTEAVRGAIELARRLGLPVPEQILQRYPHQLSGGQLQRLMAAMAMTCSPKLLILDEPTTAIDVTTQVGVLALFKEMVRESGVAALYVTHDLAVVTQIAHRLIILQHGQMVESASTDRFLRGPREPYTRELLAAVRPAPAMKAEPNGAAAERARTSLISIRGIDAGYGPVVRGSSSFKVLDNVTFNVAEGEVVGVIGESGSGKSTLARVISGLLPQSAGEVFLRGATLPATVAKRSKKQLQHIQIVFQSPDTALNSRQRIGEILDRPLQFYFGTSARARSARVTELLSMVELPASYAARYPRELSGGQRQRVSLARALAAEPSIILCDEVTSALDTVVSKAIIDLLMKLKSTLGMSLIFISHDISTVASIADRIVVLYQGRVAAEGTTNKVLSPPYHPYTQLLLSSVPEMRQGWLEEVQATRKELAVKEGLVA